MLGGGARDVTPLEAALVDLVRASWARPARLGPDDLRALRAVAGDGALDYVFVVGGFHFINRIADLLHVDAEVLPEALRRFEALRRLSVRMMALMFGRVIDLGNRTDAATWEPLAARIAQRVGRPVDAALTPLRARPRLLEILALALEERDERNALPRATIARVQRAVEAALPRAEDEATGLHPRPADPVEAFAFVGTRYAQRTTPEMIAALRRAGYDDLGILDLAITIADANNWARLWRWLALPPDISYLEA